MKQNSQWLSQVRTRSNRALSTSTPRGLPAGFSTSTSRCSPPESRASATDGSSTSSWYSMTSRGTRSLMVRIWSPGTTPARSAGDPAATATTTGADMAPRLPTPREAPGRVPTCHPPRRPRRSPDGSTGCYWPNPGASAPGWRWPSRLWRGWCGPSTCPSTATTRSFTTSWWWNALRLSAWSS